MNKFAFVNHYLTTDFLNDVPFLSAISQSKRKWLVSKLPPYKYMYLRPVISAIGTRAIGLGVICPLLPEHFVTLTSQQVFRKILTAARVGEKFGAKIIGLGGFTSIFGNEGEEIAQDLSVAVTSGNTYTAVLAVEGILKAAATLGLELRDSQLAIIGATGDIGSICTKILARKVKQLILAARNEKRLQEFADTIVGQNSCDIRISRHVSDVVKQADIILTATSAITTIIDVHDPRPGSIVCDVSYPANVAKDVLRKRNDVFVFEGGLATWPYCDQLEQKERLRRFCPPGTVHGCLAETMLLALEGKFVDFSIGRGRITFDRFEEMSSLAKKHGFGLAPFQYGSLVYDEKRINAIRQIRLTSRRSPKAVIVPRVTVGVKQEW